MFGVDYALEDKPAPLSDVCARGAGRTCSASAAAHGVARRAHRSLPCARARHAPVRRLAQVTVGKRTDDVEIVSGLDSDEAVEPSAAYYADSNKDADREPVYNSDLGLAVEKLRDGVTPQMLWSVI